MKKVNLAKIFLLFLFLLTPLPVYAESGSILSNFHPYLTLREDYTDNFNLTSTNKKEDFITTVSPGIRFSTLPTGSTTPVLPGFSTLPAITTSPVSGVDLNYLLGLVSYAHSSEKNYISHSGTMNAWYLPEHGLNLRLREYFLRSEEPHEQAYAAEAVPGEFILVSQRVRSPYIRNVVEPSAGYRFGKESSFDLYYRNNIYQTQNPASENSQENFINPRLTYWFDIRNGVTLQYGFTRGEFDRSPDFTGHMASGRYIHRFEPHTSVFADYSYLTRDFESPGTDYDVHSPSIGVEHAFSPTLSGKAQAGYFWQIPQDGPTHGGFTYSLGLTQTGEKTTYALSFQGGYQEVYFATENLGSTRYDKAIASISHRLTQRLTLGLLGIVGDSQFYSSDRKDWYWQPTGTATYHIFRWMSLSLSAYHLQSYSNINGLDYAENRVTFWVNLTD